MKKHNFTKIFLILFAFIASLFTIGSSSFVFTLNADNRAPQRKDPVCYVTSSTAGTKYFANGDKAFEYAYNDTAANSIYMIVGNQMELTKNTILSNNDSLYLPIDGETIYAQVSVQRDNGYDFPETRKCLLTINSGVTFTNNGKIYIGGTQNGGNGGFSPNGNTYKNYSEIHVNNNAKILCSSGSYIECNGYISGDINSETNLPTSSIVFNSGSSIRTFYTIIEHRGGSLFTGMAADDVGSFIEGAISIGSEPEEPTIADLKTFAYNRHYIDNLFNINFTFNYNSILTAYTTLYANGQYNSTTINFIGSNSSYFLNFSSGSKLIGYFNKDLEKIKYDFYGSLEVNSISIVVTTSKSVSVITAYIKIGLDSKDVFFPVPYYYDITLYPIDANTEANVTFNQRIKLLPGSSLFVAKGVNVSVPEILVCKNDYFYRDGVSIETSGTGNSKYPSKPDASMILNGKLTANKVGGLINTTSIAAELTIRQDNQPISYEVIDSSSATAEVTLLIVYNTSVSYSKPEYEEITVPVIGPILSDGNIGNQTLNISRYVSNYNESLGQYYWEIPTTVVFSAAEICDGSSNTASANKTNEGAISYSFNGRGYMSDNSEVTTGLVFNWVLKNSSGSQLKTGTDSTFSYDFPNSDETYSLSLTITVDGVPKSDTISIKITKKSTSCFTENSLISTQRGEVKIQDLRGTDKLLSLNHFTGKLEYSNIFAIANHGYKKYETILMKFNDGTTFNIVENHILFDITLNKYVTIDTENYVEFISHEFYKFDNGKMTSVMLDCAQLIIKECYCYGLITDYNLNYFTNSLLNMSLGTPLLFNTFKFDGYQYNQSQVQYEINNYGLFEYKDFENLTTYHIFDRLNFKYLKIGLRKGYYTWTDIVNMTKFFNLYLLNPNDEVIYYSGNNLNN